MAASVMAVNLEVCSQSSFAPVIVGREMVPSWQFAPLTHTALESGYIDGIVEGKNSTHQELGPERPEVRCGQASAVGIAEALAATQGYHVLTPGPVPSGDAYAPSHSVGVSWMS